MEYRLANVSTETKTLKCYLNKGMQFTSLSRGNWIGGFALDWHREPVTLNIEPGDSFVDTEHLVSIDTTGLEPGEYQVALGSAFRYPDDNDLQSTHEIPHRGSVAFTIVGESTVSISELPKSDIHWGKPNNGLQLGAKFTGDPTAFAIGTTIEADLFLGNMTDQPIECSVVVPHISVGWLVNVTDNNCNTIKLESPLLPIYSPYMEQRVFSLKLASGEIVPITVEGKPLRSRPTFETASTKQLTPIWTEVLTTDDRVEFWKSQKFGSFSQLITQGGAYSATFNVTLIRPEIPALRLELDSGNVPFTVLGNDALVNTTIVGEKERNDVVVTRPGKLTGQVGVEGLIPKIHQIAGKISNDLQGVSVTARFEIEQSTDGKSNDTKHKLIHTASVTSDAEGKYAIVVPDEIASIDGVLVSLRVEYPGYLTRYQERVNINKVQDASSPISLRASRNLKGQVLLPDGSPAKAAVVVTDSKYRPYSWKFPEENYDYPASSFTVTDSNGNFEIATDPSGATLVARLDGHAPLIVDDLYGGSLLNTPAEESQEFRLTRSIRAGGVVQTHDGQPIGGAIVVINRANNWDEFHMPLSFATSVAADERGNFVLPPLPADTFTLSVTAKLNDQEQVTEYNKITAENFPLPMRAAFLGHWNGFPLPKSTPQVNLLNVVIPEMEVDLEKLAGSVAIPLTPRIELKGVETIQGREQTKLFGFLTEISVDRQSGPIDLGNLRVNVKPRDQQALNQKGNDLSGKREDLVRRIDRAASQRDEAQKYSSEYVRLDYMLKNQDLLLAKFDLENATAKIVVPNAPEATSERIAALRELLRIRWGLPVDGIQVGLGKIDDRNQFEPTEKISFQVYIRNVTEKQITQKLRWFDAANSTALLRSLAGSPTNIILSIRSGSPPDQEAELRLEPGETRELPHGRFEMDTTGLPPGVYSVDANFPVVFPNQAGESATRIARPIDSDGMPFELLFRFELIGEQPLPDVAPVDSSSEVAETSEVKWGTPVFGLQAGASFRMDATNSGEIDSAGTDSLGSSGEHHAHIGDTVKTEILVRNISSQPIKVRIEAAMGKELQSLSAIESALTQLSSRAIMRRSAVEIAEKSTRTVERTLQPGEHFIAAHQDFEIQQLVNGRERQLSLPEANRHWVPGQGDYMYRAYLKLGITDSLSISLHSGGIGIRIDADKDPQGPNQAITTESNVSSPGEPTMNNDLKEITDLIASGKTIPRQLNEKYQAVHLNLTASERLKSVTLLAVPDFVMQVLLSEPTYSYAEKVALLSELKGLNFGSMEFGLQECMANVATEYAKVDPAATREWLAMFQGAEYGVGMGLTAVLVAAKQKDPAISLEILRSLSDTEGECIVTCGDIPKYDLPASDWLKEVQRFQSQRLRLVFLGGPMVFRFGEESPEAALDYILTIPKETRNQQLGYQLVSSLLRSKRFTWTEILDWMETKLPIETRSPEHYGLLASSWSQQDNTTFQTWFQSLSDAAIRDEVIIGFAGEGQTRDWPEILKLATSVTDQNKRQAKVAWVLNAWKLTDPTAALAQLDNADVSKERRTQLHRDITARLAQIAKAGQPAFIPQVNPNRKHADQGQRTEKPAGREEQILGQWDIAPTPAKTGTVLQAESMTLKFSEQGKFESYVQRQDYVEFAAGSWKLDGNRVSVRFKPFAMQPTDKSDVEATLQFDTPDTLILDGTRFLKRSAATPVALDAKHPLHGIAKEVLSKLNTRATLPEDANDVLRMLNASSPLEIWQLVQLSDKPTMSATQVVDRFDASKATGYRLLFSRDYHESANTMQQAVLKPTELPFRVRTEQLEVVLFADQPSKAPSELRSRIAWLPAKSRWPTHDICLGDGGGYTWFVRGSIQIAHPLKNHFQLAGGDDMIASLVQMTISMKNFPHAADAYTASGMLVSYGDRAVTAVEQAVRKKKPQEDLWHTIGSLAHIRTDSSTRLLIQLYQSEDTDIRNAATYALIHVPYRQEASQVYLDLLKNRMRVEQASAACVALGLKDAIPILRELFANASKPSSLRELNTIFAARRTLDGNPIRKELSDASQTIFLSSAVDPTDEGSAVGRAIKLLKDSNDEEAVVVLALQLVSYTNKANVNHICAMGAAILREKQQGPASVLLKSILDSLPERERVEVLQKILGK